MALSNKVMNKILSKYLSYLNYDFRIKISLVNVRYTKLYTKLLSV